MERPTQKRRGVLLASAVSAAALIGCSIDSYLTDPSDVQCDGKRTKVDLEEGGIATFMVHGEDDGVATIQVRRDEQGASVKTTGDVTGPPQPLENDGFTAPTPVVEGAELSAFGAGGAWVIDVGDENVVIQGSCDGM